MGGMIGEAFHNSADGDGMNGWKYGIEPGTIRTQYGRHNHYSHYWATASTAVVQVVDESVDVGESVARSASTASAAVGEVAADRQTVASTTTA